MDSDKTIGIMINQESKIPDKTSYLQYAILYTNQYGQRMVRVINTCYEINNDQLMIYKSVDNDCLLQTIIR